MIMEMCSIEITKPVFSIGYRVLGLQITYLTLIKHQNIPICKYGIVLPVFTYTIEGARCDVQFRLL